MSTRLTPRDMRGLYQSRLRGSASAILEQPPEEVSAVAQGPTGLIQPVRRRPAPLRRGEFLPVVPAAVVAAAPAWVSPITQAYPPKRPVQRRGEFLALPLPTAAAPRLVAPSRRRQPAVRRGEFFPIVPAPVVAVPPAYVPPPLAVRRRPTPTRRGELWPLPPPPVVAAGPGPWLPAQLTHRRTPTQTRRAEWFTIPLVGAAPAAPLAVVAPFITHRPYRSLTRRGRLLPTPPPTPPTPSFLLAARRRPPSRPRGRIWTLPPSVPPAGPAPWPPRITQATRRRFARRPSRAQFWPFLLGAAGPVAPAKAYSYPAVSASVTSVDPVTAAETSSPAVSANRTSVDPVTATDTSAPAATRTATSTGGVT